MLSSACTGAGGVLGDSCFREQFTTKTDQPSEMSTLETSTIELFESSQFAFNHIGLSLNHPDCTFTVQHLDENFLLPRTSSPTVDKKIHHLQPVITSHIGSDQSLTNNRYKDITFFHNDNDHFDKLESFKNFDAASECDAIHQGDTLLFDSDPIDSDDSLPENLALHRILSDLYSLYGDEDSVPQTKPFQPSEPEINHFQNNPDTSGVAELTHSEDIQSNSAIYSNSQEDISSDSKYHLNSSDITDTKDGYCNSYGYSPLTPESLTHSGSFASNQSPPWSETSASMCRSHNNEDTSSGLVPADFFGLPDGSTDMKSCCPLTPESPVHGVGFGFFPPSLNAAGPSTLPAQNPELIAPAYSHVPPERGHFRFPTQSEIQTAASLAEGSTLNRSNNTLAPLQQPSKSKSLRAKHLPTSKYRSTTQLPPCRICGDPASGFHYGANTCEACKGFFRRALKRKSNFVCSKNKNCNIKGERRNLCGFCRYRKCKMEGMSKDAIKTGRYTHEKRTKDIMEIQRLRDEEEEKKVAQGNEHLHRQMEIEERKKLTSVGPRGEDIAAIVQGLIDAHEQSQILAIKVPDEFIDKQIDEYSDHYRHKEEIFGTMKPIEQEQYDDIYRHTGLDLDGREMDLVRHLNALESWSQDCMEFVKVIPGFTSLSINDQFTLLRENRPEFWMLGAYRGFDHQRKIAMRPNLKCQHQEEMSKIFTQDFTNVQFEVATTLKRLALSTEELVIVKALCLISPDRCCLEDRKAVDQIQELLLVCLQHVIAKTHPFEKWPTAIGRAFDGLASVKEISHAYWCSSSAVIRNHHLKDEILLKTIKEKLHYDPFF